MHVEYLVHFFRFRLFFFCLITGKWMKDWVLGEKVCILPLKSWKISSISSILKFLSLIMWILFWRGAAN